MELLQKKEIGQYVAEDFRTAAIFTEYGIDFCCRGNRPLIEVCKKKNIAVDEIVLKLNGLTQQRDGTTHAFNTWPLDLLASYIEKTHHTYVASNIPVLLQYLSKLCKVHGNRHSELFKIYNLFEEVSEELTLHMKKEELVLFPRIKEMAQRSNLELPLETAHFGTVQNPISMMEHEHDKAGQIFRTIRKLTNAYTPPQDACNTYQVTFAMLEEFERDLHQHIHLENNILFPKAIELEQLLSVDPNVDA